MGQLFSPPTHTTPRPLKDSHSPAQHRPFETQSVPSVPDLGSVGLVMFDGGSGLSPFPSLPVVYLPCLCVLAGWVGWYRRVGGEGVWEAEGMETR